MAVIGAGPHEIGEERQLLAGEHGEGDQRVHDHPDLAIDPPGHQRRAVDRRDRRCGD